MRESHTLIRVFVAMILDGIVTGRVSALIRVMTDPVILVAEIVETKYFLLVCDHLLMKIDN